MASNPAVIMNGSVIEECPVCWRSFGSLLPPISIPCGHSFSEDCSPSLRKCPLCRRKITSSTTRATNYTLLSLIDKVNTATNRITQDQSCQTDSLQPQIVRRPRRQTIDAINSSNVQDSGQNQSRLVSFRLKDIGLGPKGCLEFKFR